MELVSELNKIGEKDVRHNFADFYLTFNFDHFYSKAMFNMILNGERDSASSKFLPLVARCMTVYGNHTNDYRNIKPTVQNLLDRYNSVNYVPITIDQLQRVVGKDVVAIRRAINSNKQGKIYNDLHDVLQYNLYHLDLDWKHLFQNIQAYRFLENQLMRAQIGDGKQIATLYDVSTQTGISLDILQNLWMVCSDADQYQKTYQSLVQLIKPYAIQIS